MYAPMVDGLSGTANWAAVKARSKTDVAQRRAVSEGASGVCAHPSAQGVQPSPFTTAGEASSGAPAAAPRHDWEPFFDRIGSMLPHDASTTAMAAFGQLMNDFHGYNKSSTPLTRAERALGVRKRAQDFAPGMVLPL